MPIWDRFKKYQIVSFAICLVAILSLIPYGIVRLRAGSAWQGIVPSIVDDDVYYFARLKEMTEGHFLAGNPYFIEHKSDISPAFVVADWLALPPYALFGVERGMLWNLVIWSGIFVISSFVLLRRLQLSAKSAAAIAVLLYVQSYYFFIRPVSLQTVMPFAIAFWIALLAWIERPKRTTQAIWLIVALVATVYIYTYLAQIAIVTMAIVGVGALWKKDWSRVLRLTGIAAISLIGLIPFIWMTLKQLSHPDYWSSMARIGLVATHIPTGFALQIVAMTVLGIVPWLFLSKKKEGLEVHRDFFLITGAAIALTSVSNVLSGKELEISNHIARFFYPWLMISLCAWLAQFGKVFFKEKTGQKWVMVGVVILATACCLAPLRLSYLTLQAAAATDASMQDIAPVMNWLNEYAKNQVVWADDRLSAQIPIWTNSSVLFSAFGGLHLVSQSEIEERYLVSRALENTTVETIQKENRLFSGAGLAVHGAQAHNKEVVLCQMLRMEKCGQIQTPITWRGEQYFAGMKDRFDAIQSHLPDVARKYHVTFILQDGARHLDWQLDRLPGLEKVFEQGKYRLYKLAP